MDNPLRGIALVLASTFVFSLSDATGKFLTGYLPVTEIAWIRYVIFVGFAFALVLRSGPGRFHVRRPGLQILRGLGLLGSALAFIFSLRYLPLADASAIGFISPLLTSVLAIPLLGEVVGLQRWIGGIVGLIGVLIVVRPGTGAFHPAALLVLLSSTSWALSSVLTRILVGADSPTATLMWSAMTGAVVLTAVQPFDFVPPTAWQLGLLLMLGIIASGGQYLTVLAYRHAAASVLAPFNYVQLVWATALGYLVFSAVPDLWTFAGAGIIVASGFYTLQYERGERRRALRPDSRAPPRSAPATPRA
jgi:drug/metabolite transporter (DMT)-like permease